MAATIFAGIGYNVLANGHLHEDAYILFVYAEEFARSGRISYNPGGPPTEGATDFLWMVALAGFYALGIPSGIAALMLNTLGVGLIAWLITSGLRTHRAPVWLIAALALALPFVWFVQSGYGGFSAPFFASIALLIAVLLIEQRGLLWVPLLSLLLALLRPDGVILGVGFTVIGLAFCPAHRRRRYLILCAAAVLGGALYFLWRWRYFGAFLPLPLLVKSAGDRTLLGLEKTLDYLSTHGWLLIAGLAGGLIAHQRPRRIAIVALPFIALLVFLCFGLQTQNIAFRFQAPLTAFAVYCAAIGLAVAYRTASPGLPRAALLGAVAGFLAINDARYFRFEMRALLDGNYSHFFPIALAPSISDRAVVAVTEAGRMAYWLPGTTVDLVGLNTAETAVNPPDAAFLARLEPDMILLHHGGVVRLTCGDENPPFCALSQEELALAYRQAGGRSGERVRQAQFAILDHLLERVTDYQLILVRNGWLYDHVYAVKRGGLIDQRDVASALEKSFSPEGKVSYLQATAAR
ncbi:MAG: hypothetical protein AAGG54_00495 [Pseudomonadota bacterium]